MANVEHSTLTGSDLHESKGVAAAANNRVYVTNGAGSGSWTTVPAAAITAAGVLVFQQQLYHIRDERSSGTDGDTIASANTWTTRALNTEKSDDLGITPSGNQLSLVAGTYWVEAEATTFVQGNSNRTSGFGNTFLCKLRLRNITDSTTLIASNACQMNNNDDGGGSNQFTQYCCVNTMAQRIVLAGTKTIELQSWWNGTIASPTVKGGKAVSSGENEVYLDLKIWKTA